MRKKNRQYCGFLRRHPIEFTDPHEVADGFGNSYFPDAGLHWRIIWRSFFLFQSSAMHTLLWRDAASLLQTES